VTGTSNPETEQKMSSYGYDKVAATADEVAAFVAKKGHRPGVNRVQCGVCGARLWFSGFTAASHERGKQHQSAERALRMAREMERHAAAHPAKPSTNVGPAAEVVEPAPVAPEYRPVTSTVVAEHAPIGVLLWPVRSPEFAPNFTLASVSIVRDAYSSYVVWTYENGDVRNFELGQEVAVQMPSKHVSLPAADGRTWWNLLNADGTPVMAGEYAAPNGQRFRIGSAPDVNALGENGKPLKVVVDLLPSATGCAWEVYADQLGHGWRWVNGPEFPAGTTEYAAYAAELRAELKKWAAREGEYAAK
jgi:hypothetical protein